MARCSSGLKRDVDEFGGSFAVFEALSDHAQGKGLHAGDCFVAVGSVAHHAGQGRHLGEPAAVVLALDLDRKNHDRTVPSGPAVYQANGADGVSTLNTRIQRAVHEDVAIVAYDPAWPEEFRREKAHLLSCLPRDLKIQLATAHPNDRVAYTRGKTDFINAVTEQARLEVRGG